RSVVAEVVGEVVDVEVDVRSHDVVAHLHGVFADVGHHQFGMRSCEGEAAADGFPQSMRFAVADVFADENRAERYRQERKVLPPLSQIGDRDQAGVAVRKTRFVDDEPRIYLPSGHRRYDAVEAHAFGVLGPSAQRHLKKKKRRRAFAGNGDALLLHVGKELGSAFGTGDEQRAAAASYRAARTQDAVAFGEIRQSAVT